MFTNYLKTALRTFRRHKGYSLVNIIGLAIGLAGSALILLYVQSELSYDRFNTKADRIYRIYKQDPGNVFIGSDYFAVVPGPFGKTMESEFPEIESTVKFASVGSGLVRVDGKTTLEKGMLWAEPTVFGIFDFPLVEGDPQTALQEPNSVVLSEETAHRLFGDRDPMGRIVRVRDKYDMRVTGVMRDIPKNSHLTASMFLSFATYEAEREKDMNWGNSSYYTYVLLRKGADPNALRRKMPAFVEAHMGALFKKWEREPSRFYLQPLTDIHLHSTHINFGPGGEGDIKTVYILSALALILLATASINYMNLATARATLRAREVGVRKVVGAGRRELVQQFLGESLFVTFVAAFLALVIVEASLSPFAHLVGRPMTSALLSGAGFIGGFFLITFLVGLVSGSYPAFFLSAFSPVHVLKSASSGRDRGWLRNALVVVQFTAAIALAIGAFIILDQLRFIQSSDPGYNRDHVVAVRVAYQDVVKKLPAFRSEIEKLASVAGTTVSTSLPIEVSSSTGISIVADDGQKVEAQSYQMYADEDFLNVYKIPLVEGKFFSDGPVDENKEADEYVVNQTFARTFGLKHPVGKVIKRGDTKATIIGVMKDFHLHSYRQEIAPLFIARGDARWGAYVSIRLRSPSSGAATDVPGTIGQLRQAWQRTVKDYPFDYSFVDDSFRRMYERDEKLGEIVSLFTVLALFVGSIGLLGLSTFVIQSRTKEIGIRKVLGATSPSVVVLLSSKFMILVGISNLVAWPVAYWVMTRWLSDFAYRVTLGPGLFLLAGGGAALLALATVSAQAIRASTANPVEALRYE
jgi:putative ABC transport system permease protein